MKVGRFLALFALGVAASAHLACPGEVSAQARKTESPVKNERAKGEIGSKEDLNAGLLNAVEVNDISAVQKAIEKGASPDAADGEFVSVLMKASLYGYSEIVDLLLRFGANPKLEDNNGNTALVMAVWAGHPDIVQTLTAYGASSTVRAQGTVPFPMERGMTPLMAACITGNTGVAMQLLGNGAKVDIRDQDGQTALMNAARYGNEEIVRLLLDNGARINLRDRYGRTPLMLATIFDQPAIVQALIKRGSNLYLIDKEGMSAAKYANALERDAILQMLRDAGVRAYKGRF